MSILASARALLLATAKAVAAPVMQQGRHLRAQRLAASGAALPNPDRIADGLEETIGALTGRATKPSWWQTAIAKTQQLAINPDALFRGQSLWGWLDNPQVRGALRTLAARRLDAGSEPGADETDLAILKSKYEELVGDAGAAAGGIIDVVLDVLVAGVQADLTAHPDARALSLQLQATSEAHGGKLEDLTEAVRDLRASAKGAFLAGPQSANPKGRTSRRAMAKAPAGAPSLTSATHTKVRTPAAPAPGNGWPLC
jgi:hypothetical protein